MSLGMARGGQTTGIFLLHDRGDKLSDCYADYFSKDSNCRRMLCACGPSQHSLLCFSLL